MKAKSLILSVALISILFNSCSKDPEVKNTKVDCTKQVSIKQGLYGTCKFLYGDWMPGSETCCKWYPVKRTIYFYQATADTQTVRIGGASSPWYSQINTKLVAQIQSDENGCYQVSLPKGEYSIFILENDKYYANTMCDKFIVNCVTIDSNKTVDRDLTIDYMAID